MMEEIEKLLRELARKMADEEIKNYPVRVFVGGSEVDWDSCTTSGGEIKIEISRRFISTTSKNKARS